MFTEQDLSELVQFRSDGSPVLSIYLNVDPSQQSSDQHKLSMRSLLKEVAGEASSEDVQAMERYFDFEYERQGKGLALFSCKDSDFWRSYWLAVPVHNLAYVSPRPYIKPLTDVLDAYGRYARRCSGCGGHARRHGRPHGAQGRSDGPAEYARGGGSNRDVLP